MLLCIDGNESQKRRLRVRNIDDDTTEVSERTDTRNRASVFFLEVDEVDVFKDEVKKKSKGKEKATPTDDSVCAQNCSLNIISINLLLGTSRK